MPGRGSETSTHPPTQHCAPNRCHHGSEPPSDTEGPERVPAMLYVHAQGPSPVGPSQPGHPPSHPPSTPAHSHLPCSPGEHLGRKGHEGRGDMEPPAVGKPRTPGGGRACPVRPGPAQSSSPPQRSPLSPTCSRSQDTWLAPHQGFPLKSSLCPFYPLSTVRIESLGCLLFPPTELREGATTLGHTHCSAAPPSPEPASEGSKQC